MTELDETVLAIIAFRGPVSAYDVRKVFSASLTLGWSSSTGSIYPSIRRLVAAGFAEAGEASGGRGTRKLTITAAGRRAVNDWLSADTSAIASATPDPIRTRCAFLPLLEAEEQLAFLDGALHSTEEALAASEQTREQRLKEGQGPLQHLISDGVLFELRARRDWLRLVIRTMRESRLD
jgi:DNA-binding PadR family transcriptional regulator